MKCAKGHGVILMITGIDEEKNIDPKFIPQFPWPRLNVNSHEPQNQPVIGTIWQTSNVLWHYYKPTREIRDALKAFMKIKEKKVDELIKNHITITNQNLYLGGDDRGRLRNNEKTKDFDHYHLKVKDAQKGNLTIVYSVAINNASTHPVTINLIAVVDHSHYDNSHGLSALAKLAANATYTPMVLKETTWPLFAWLKQIIR